MGEKDMMLLGILTERSLLANKGGEGETKSFLYCVSAFIVVSVLHIIAEIALSPVKILLPSGGEESMVYDMLMLGIALTALTASR